MEQEPVKESQEDIESILDGLFEKETNLFKRYVELFGAPNEEVTNWAYAAEMGAIASADTEQAKRDIEEFTAFLEMEIAKKEAETRS